MRVGLFMFWVAAVVLPMSTYAAAYRCVGADGSVHFSDRPESDSECTDMKLPKTRAAPAPKAQAANAAGRAGAKTPSFDPANLVGQWIEETSDQTIYLTLSPGNDAEWRVIFKGQPWSIGKGTWKLSDRRLVLNLHWKEGRNENKNFQGVSLGSSIYNITSLSADTLVLVDSDGFGSASTFKK